MEEQEKKTVKGRDLYEWVQSLVGSVLVVVAIFTFGVRMLGVDGHSMLNTLQHNDRLLVVNPIFYHDYKYGDIVILRKNGVFDNDPIVKRVIAVGGQTVDIDFDAGVVYVDGGGMLEEDYIREPTYTAEGHGISPDGAGGLHFRHGRQPTTAPATAGTTGWARWTPGMSSARRRFCCFPGPD